MDIEQNSRCNFRCTMCQVSAWERGKRAEDMPFDQFKDFIDSVPTLTEVKLHGMGEPLLHKDFIAMVRYLVDKDIWVRTTVNGSLLHARDNYKKLIDAGIGEVQTSFDGANKEVFEKIRRKSNFERVVNNLTLLNEYANTKDRPYTRMWVVVQRYNRHQIFDFVELALKMKFKRLSFSMSLNDWGQDQWYDNNESLQPDPLTDKEKSTLLQMSQSSGLDISLWEQADTYKTAPQAVLCPWIFGRSYIGSDLRIAPCSIIGNPDVADLGDARNFTHEWNGDSYRTFRQAHLEGRIPRCCQQCYAVTHTRRQ